MKRRSVGFSAEDSPERSLFIDQKPKKRSGVERAARPGGQCRPFPFNGSSR